MRLNLGKPMASELESGKRRCASFAWAFTNFWSKREWEIDGAYPRLKYRARSTSNDLFVFRFNPFPLRHLTEHLVWALDDRFRVEKAPC